MSAGEHLTRHFAWVDLLPAGDVSTREPRAEVLPTDAPLPAALRLVRRQIVAGYPLEDRVRCVAAQARGLADRVGLVVGLALHSAERLKCATEGLSRFRALERPNQRGLDRSVETHGTNSGRK